MLTRYAIVGFLGYIDNENCHEYGMIASRYGWEGNEKPTTDEAIAALKARANSLGIEVGAYDWFHDKTGWWCLGFKEYVSYDISCCSRKVAAWEIMKDQKIDNDFVLADGEASYTSSKAPRGEVKGEVVIETEMDEEGIEYTYYDIVRMVAA